MLATSVVLKLQLFLDYSLKYLMNSFLYRISTECLKGQMLVIILRTITKDQITSNCQLVAPILAEVLEDIPMAMATTSHHHYLLMGLVQKVTITTTTSQNKQSAEPMALSV